MSKLKINIDHSSDTVDIIETDNAFDIFDSEERKISIKAFKNELIKELTQLPKCSEMIVHENLNDFKIPLNDLGFIELWWFSDDPIYGIIIISCDHEFSRQAMQLIAQILQKITQKNSELCVLQ